MVNTDMRLYNYFAFGEADVYGQSQLSENPEGTIKMAINTISQSIQNNIRYQDCTYIGLTTAEVKDTFVIQYENERLKVLYVNPKGRFKQVFMGLL